MRYVEPVFRPPSEAYSYILQITYGCTHNQCTFCGMYLNKKFRVRPVEEVQQDIETAARLYPDTRRVFLADGDAMILTTDKLTRILEALNHAFPNLNRVGIYSDAHGINRKTETELAGLKQLKLGVIYMGLESGSEAILKKVRKGCTAQEMTEAVLKARASGIKTSVIGLLGLGGKELSDEHATLTGRVVSNMSPTFFSALTVTLVPGTELMARANQGEFTPLSPLESLEEMGRLINHIDPAKPVIFRTNHASNYLPLEGTLPKDKARLAETIRHAIEHKILKPEWMRGL